MLEVESLEVNIRNFTLSIESFKVLDGETALILGPNGSGKTIFLNTLLGHVNPDKGSVKYNGQSVDKEGWQKFVGAYIDSEYLIPFLKPYEYFEFFARNRSVKMTDANRQIQSLACYLNLSFDNKKRIREYSKGNQHKIGLISTLIGRPSLIIWDEPFANLDEQSTAALSDLIKEIKRDRQQSLILTNHVDTQLSYHSLHKLDEGFLTRVV